MAGITLAQAQSKLDMWLAAEEALATSQSYEMSDGTSSRKLTRANLKDIGERIKYWDSVVKRLDPSAAGRGRTRYVVPE
jgi:hypothetical protein